MIFRTGMLSVIVAGLILSPVAAVDKSQVYKYDSAVRTEVTINRPAAEVWPILVDLASWKDSIGSLDHVSGEPGAEGELKFMTPAGGTAEDGFFIKTVLLVPPKQFVIKVFPKDDSFLCFADFTLTEEGGITHIVYDVYTEDRFVGVTDEKALALGEKIRQATIDKHNTENRRLKELVEKEKDS
jgi:uncharacterized protein YndB with AHSA1/START domain